MLEPSELSVVIPTYQRGQILLATLNRILSLGKRPGEILVVDQTRQHPADVQQALDRLEKNGSIRRLVFSPPSIPRAMNIGLKSAQGCVVLFVDDDVEPIGEWVAAHAARHGREFAAVCGQVLQPGQAPEDRDPPKGWKGFGFADMEFPFHSTRPAEIKNVMAGNLSVDREVAMALGGFDEQYIGSAYRLETDFALRLTAAGHRILFAPEASLRHLRLSSGGTRSAGDHLRCPSPLHGVGDYYFALRHGHGAARFAYILKRPFRECVNRYYLKHPWQMPRKFISECRALVMARKLIAMGPKFMDATGGFHA